MKNGDTLIGLFQDMFTGNMLTFNPGWDQEAQNLDDFTDVHRIKQILEEKGIAVNAYNEAQGSGPASFMVTDPDGNVLLFDQHR